MKKTGGKFEKGRMRFARTMDDAEKYDTVGANRIRPIKQKQCIAIYSRLYRNRNDMNEPKS